MKIIAITLAVFFVAVTAFACPDLSGAYICTADDMETYTQVYTQFQYKNGVIAYVSIYGGHASFLKADGLPYESLFITGDLSQYFRSKSVRICEGNSFVSTITDDYYAGSSWEGPVVKQLKSQVTLTQDAQKNLVTETKSLDDGSVTQKVCIRK